MFTFRAGAQCLVFKVLNIFLLRSNSENSVCLLLKSKSFVQQFYRIPLHKTSSAMSQKTILSFFKSVEQSKPKESKSQQVAVESPVKNQKKRKVKCIESDDESSDIPNKKLNGECSQTSATSVNKGDKSPSKNLENGNIGRKNGDISPRKSPEQKKIKSEEEEIGSSQSSNKIEIQNSSYKKDIKENDESADKLSEVTEKLCNTNQNGSSDFIPKRKTARKQMLSARKVKQNDVTLVKEEPSTADSDVQDTTPESNEADQDKNKKSEADRTNDTSSNQTEVLEKCNRSEKSPESDKKVVMKVIDSKQNKRSPRALKTESTESKRSTKKESEASKKSAKKESEASKKCSKKESVQNFFTPLKKTEISTSTKEKDESMEIENDDSPVKKVPKKKTQCLESDEEEESEQGVSSEVSVKEENIEMANDAESSETSEVTENSSVASSEMKNSPSKEPKTESAKTDPEKQKLSIKSTSATDTIYDPSKSNYHPIEDAFWKKGEKVPYLALAKTLELIENTSGRLKTIEILSNYFRSVIVLSPDDFLHSVYLCLNRVAPEYEGIEMGVGDTLLMKAVAQATGRTLEKIKAEVAIKGDLGLVSESSRGNQRVMFAPPKLTVSAVFNKFLDIAKMTGNSAMAKKTDKIKGLFVACRDCEAKYIIRSLSGKLRIGLAEQSILSAIARAAIITPPGQSYPPEIIDASKGMSPDKFKEFLNSQTLILKTAYCECPNYDLIIPVLLKEGISALPDRCQLSPGVPLKPMLAHPTAGIDIVLERFDKNAFTCEFKYDGERAQIHMNEKGEVKIFSRNQEDNTSKYPDIIKRLPNTLKESTKSFILDSEAVAWDKETKQILPFQVLSTRKRKDAKESEIVVQVCVMAFDLLYLNGESLVKKPLKERRELLHSSFNEVESEFMFAQYRDGDNAETMQEFLDESVKGNCEGLMVKALEVDASYEIAKRSHNWLKLKKDYLQGIGDTLDLVVIGGYFGKGKRTGSYGGFLLACYDDENEEFQSICKLGTGFKDDTLEAHTTFLKQHVIREPKSYYRYDSSLQPDEWFDSVQVWEIKCADLSISPVHKAAIGIVDPKKGISLRFPRFIRIREDKSPEDATNSAQIADMYKKQQQIQNTSNKNSNVEEDYY